MKKINRDKMRRVRFSPKDGMTITAASLVDEPAIEQNYQYFSAVPKEAQNFVVSSEEKMEITGPAMRANFDIIRIDQTTNEPYLCYFEAEDVSTFAEQFLKSDAFKQANFMHGTYFTQDIFAKESWIVRDENMDTALALGFKDLNVGDWYITYKVLNKELWAEIKKSKLAGFSVELSFDEYEELEDIQNDIQDIMDSQFSSADKKSVITEIADFHLLIGDFAEQGELSFGDYPTSASECAQRALDYKATAPDNTCGSAIMWTRCKQISSRKPLSYSNLKRIAMNSKLETKASALDYSDGCTGLIFDAYGGVAMVDYAVKKLAQIDSLVKNEITLQEDLKRKSMPWYRP